MTNEEVKSAVVRWLSLVLAVEIIQDHQQGHRPAPTYGTLTLANWREVNDHPIDEVWEESIFPIETENTEVVQLEDSNPLETPDVITVAPQVEMEWVFILMIHGPGGGEYLRRLQVLRHWVQSIQPALVLFDVSSVNNIPDLQGEKWVPRSQVNISIRGIVSETVPVDTIEQVPVGITREGV